MKNESRDLWSLTVRQYYESLWGYRHMGPYRFALDLGKISFILEFWWLRDKRNYV